MLVTRIIDKFIERFREYILMRLKNHFGEDYYYKAFSRKLMKHLDDNPEYWDLRSLMLIFKSIRAPF